MKLDELRELLQMMDEHELVELELEREGVKVRLCKQRQSDGQTIIQQIPAHASVPAPQVQAPAGAPAAALPSNRIEIKSPMVGTFYRAPAPEAPPFVEVGARIEVGQVLCILEAMKLMNELKSEVSGTIVGIKAENGHPVEFGQVLFIVEPA